MHTKHQLGICSWVLAWPKLVRIGLTGGGLALAVATSGCTVFKPYVDAKEIVIDKSIGGGQHFPKLSLAIDEVGASRDTVQRRRNQVTYIRSALGLTSAAGVMGATIAGIYGAHNDAVIAFGLGAGAAYAGSTLFTSTTKSGLYEAANQALSCVATTGMQTINTWEDINREIDGYGIQAGSAANHLVTYDNGTYKDDAALVAGLKAAADAYASARSLFIQFSAMDPTGARLVKMAEGAVLEVLNSKLAEAEPNPDAILAAFGGIGRMAATYVPAPVGVKTTVPAKQPLEIPGFEVFRIAPLVPQIPEPVRKEMAELTLALNDAAATITKQVGDAVNKLNEVGKQCVLKMPEIPPLSASPSEAVVQKDATVKVQLAGGNLPLTCDWTGDAKPGGAIECVLIGRELILIGKSNIEASKIYKLRVSDSRAVPSHIDIVVKTAEKPAEKPVEKPAEKPE